MTERKVQCSLKNFHRVVPAVEVWWCDRTGKDTRACALNFSFGFVAQGCGDTHSLTHARTHALTHSRTHARTHSLTHTHTHSLHSLSTHSICGPRHSGAANVSTMPPPPPPRAHTHTRMNCRGHSFLPAAGEKMDDSWATERRRV